MLPALQLSLYLLVVVMVGRSLLTVCPTFTPATVLGQHIHSRASSSSAVAVP